MVIEIMVDGGERVRHYSDNDVMIRQIETGILYEDAVDVLPCAYTYEETDTPIMDMDISDSEALGIITGVIGNEAE